ncbi:hypothetical protein RhiirC2_722027, partial [Rhizophagus irregularis]
MACEAIRPYKMRKMANKKLRKEASIVSEISYESEATESELSGSGSPRIDKSKKSKKSASTESESGFSGSSSDSSSRSGKRKKPKKSATITPKRYQRVSELSKNMKEALRRDLFWNLARMPEDAQLDIEQTFESQKDKVTKTIVPTLMKTLDLVTYPIGEGVIYDMMHRRHRHQREHARNKKKSQIERKREAERKHNNSRRLE